MAERWQAQPGRTPINWNVAPAEADDLSPDRAAQALAVRDDRDRVWVWIDGTTVMIAPPAPPPSRRTASGRTATDALSSPMPATVVGVTATIGDRVTMGDTLLLLEAMKMEVPLRAPHDGRVTAVHCAVGDLVQPGTPLVELAAEVE